MGSVLSAQTNSEDEITENDEFHDAEDKVDITDTMNVTDAIESKFSHICVNTSKITYEKVADIESELDYYEKVALVFLLYEQPDNALQSLLVEYANIKQGLSTNLLSDWAKSKHLSTSSWQDRFVEALCVIQNYAILRRLGFDNKEEMKERYLPTRPYASLHLNKVMKALYCLCEQLSFENEKILLTYLADDFQMLDMSFQEFDENYLELYLLHCFSMKYITKEDLSHFVAILKKMKLYQEADRLESLIHIGTGDSQESVSKKSSTAQKVIEKNDNVIVNSNTCNFDLTKLTENYANPTIKSCSHNSVIGDNSIVKNISSSDSYEIDPDNVGICLIINQKEFYKENKQAILLEEKLEYLERPKHDLEKRQGTDVDKTALSEIFKKLGFKIVVRENLNHRQMIPNIKDVMKNFSNKHSCFVICILSHGVENKIYAANSIPISINNIRDAMHDIHCTSLLGKPKILIIQSCQGTEIQKVIRAPSDDNVTDGPSNNEDSELNLINDKTGVPEKRDLIICMSTVSGFASVRNKNEGTWYIQELCKTIDEKCDEDHFQDILTMVNNKVSNRRWKKEGKGIVTMVPESTTTLSKKLYLQKIRKSSE